MQFSEINPKLLTSVKAWIVSDSEQFISDFSIRLFNKLSKESKLSFVITVVETANRNKLKNVDDLKTLYLTPKFIKLRINKTISFEDSVISEIDAMK